ncbi:restriction endonuclease subunit S [Bifidobacterium longum]|uniref:restriction endonuclease subunit S n=1 Tax=Bifidobacterium longum TaxID=216816 RepID=UPI0022B7F608|nr:restriction endonuclease subunit S [Bifidobacterium longum]MDL5542011.1 restriction endonuclease subunit S [Bifidobacterium longum]
MFGGLNFNATLSDVAEITMGQSPAGSSYNEEGAGIIFYQGRGEFGWRFPKRRLYTTEPKRLACEGDVLMSVRAPVGDLNVAFENCCIGRGLAAIHSETPSFALYLMRFLKPQLEAYNGEGTVFGSINGKALKSLEVALPSHNEVMQFESFAAPIDALIRSNENETRKLNNLRNYLLPKLMSGEIDVSKVDLTQLTNNHLLVRGHNVPNRYWKEHLWKPLLITFCRRCRTCLIRHSSNIWPKCSESHCCQFRKHQCRRIC